jgi:hypothetical protein
MRGSSNPPEEKLVAEHGVEDDEHDEHDEHPLPVAPERSVA